MAIVQDTLASAHLAYAVTLAEGLPFVATSSITLDYERHNPPIEIMVAGRHNDPHTRLDVDTVAYHADGEVEPDQIRYERIPWPTEYYVATATGRMVGYPPVQVRSDERISRATWGRPRAGDFMYAWRIVGLLRSIPNLLPTHVHVPLMGRPERIGHISAETNPRYARAIIEGLGGVGTITSIDGDNTSRTCAHSVDLVLGEGAPFSVGFVHPRAGRCRAAA